MGFLGMLLSAIIGFLIGVICKTIIDSRVLHNMRKQLKEAEDANVEVIEIKDERSSKKVNYFEPF